MQKDLSMYIIICVIVQSDIQSEYLVAELFFCIREILIACKILQKCVSVNVVSCFIRKPNTLTKGIEAFRLPLFLC